MDETERDAREPNKHHAENNLRQAVAMTRLGVMLRLYRAVYGQSIRQVAGEVGVHYGTLNRVERETGTMTLPIFMKLLAWLMSPATMAPPPEPDDPADETETEGASTVRQHS